MKFEVDNLRPVILYHWAEADRNAAAWYHYSIAVKIDEEFIHLADPWMGNIFVMKIKDFEKGWYCDNGMKKWMGTVFK